MLTGYNTDVPHDDRFFHVQTEDKGTSNPFIESLVYVGGQVLLAKRTSYGDLLQQKADKSAIVGRMEDQHREIIESIRNGDLDQKVLEVFGRAETKNTETGAFDAVVSDNGDDGVERTLDEVILDYLTSEAQHDRLVLMLQEEVELEFGGTSWMTVMASSSKQGNPVAEADVELRLISTLAEPRVLAAGQTDGEGKLRVMVQIPPGQGGSSALIIAATSQVGSAELKYLL